MEAAGAVEPDTVFSDLQEVAELYAARAERVRQQVRLGVVAPEPLIEDACQFAWSRLVHHRLRVRRRTAQAWLVRTAVHEALKLLRRQGRDVSLDGLVERAGEIAPGAAPPALDELVAHRARLDGIRALPVRQQRLLWLQALGLSYEEMASCTGDTRRTVERQLLRARRSLQCLDAAEERGGGG
jgi:RNA polymerase sigma factor (sigma-70 family)